MTVKTSDCPSHMQIQDSVVIVEWDEITSIRLLPLTNEKINKKKIILALV